MNKTEAIRAMLEGKKVTKSHWPEDSFLMWDGENFVDESGCPNDINDLIAPEWELVTEWYENIPEGGIWCVVWDDLRHKKIRKILSYYPTLTFPYCDSRVNWKNATPLPFSDEIDTFMENL